jgi:oligoribonuclease (3'-5' exoribonuclease)
MNYNYLSIDCESTGLDTANDQVLELAVVLDDLSQKVNREDLEDYLKQLPVFHCYIKHGRILGNAYAISMHNRIFNIIAKEPAIEYFEDMKPGSVLLPEQVYQYLGVFLRDYGLLDQKTKVVGAGKNLAGFDYKILKTLPEFTESKAWSFHHRTIDPAMLYMKSTDKVPPSLDECLQRAGINKTVDHTAVGDALDVIRCLKMSTKLYE